MILENVVAFWLYFKENVAFIIKSTKKSRKT